MVWAGRACSVPKCGSKGSEEGRTFFAIPQDALKQGHWLQEAWESAFKTGCPLPKWGKICDKHFSENQLIRDEKKTRLKRDEVPTLNMPSIWISTPKFRKTLIAQKKLRLEEQQKSLLETRVKEEETEETPEEVEIEVDLTEDSHDVRVPASSKVICQCPGCALPDDCGECHFCLSKSRPGGSLLQSCIRRRCHSSYVKRRERRDKTGSGCTWMHLAQLACLVPGCKSTIKDPEVKFFRIPPGSGKGEERRESQWPVDVWQQRLGGIELPKSDWYICQKHFKSSQIGPSISGEPKIRKGEAPWLWLPKLQTVKKSKTNISHKVPIVPSNLLANVNKTQVGETGTCPRCNVVCAEYREFLEHIRVCLIEEQKYLDEWNWKCMECIKQGKLSESLFLTEKALKSHTLLKHHPKTGAPKKCPRCKQTFTDLQYSQYFKEHMVVCFAQEPKYVDKWAWKCATCLRMGKTFEALFVSENSLTAHRFLKHQETTNISNNGNSIHQKNGISPLCLRRRLPSQPTSRVFGETPESVSVSGGEIDDMVEADEGATSTPLTSLVASQKAGQSLTPSNIDLKTPDASFQVKRSQAQSEARAEAAKIPLPDYRRNRKRGRPPENGGETCPKCSQFVTMQYAGFLNHIRNCLTEDKKYFDGWPWKCQLCISEGRLKESLFLSESAVKTHMSIAWNHRKVHRESRSEKIVKGLSKRIKTENEVEESLQTSEYSSVDTPQPMDECKDQEESYFNEQACGKSLDPNQQLVQNFLSNSLWNS